MKLESALMSFDVFDKSLERTFAECVAREQNNWQSIEHKFPNGNNARFLYFQKSITKSTKKIMVAISGGADSEQSKGAIWTD